MNNQITEDYCSLEVNKLLQEKGFTVPCHYYYDREGNEHRIEEQSDYSKMFHKLPDEDRGIYKVTHDLAVKWIRENFNWNIEVGYRNSYKDYRGFVYPMLPNTQVHPTGAFSSNEEAREAALLYTLKNLI